MSELVVVAVVLTVLGAIGIADERGQWRRLHYWMDRLLGGGHVSWSDGR